MGFHRVIYAYCDAQGNEDCLCKSGEASGGDSKHETIASYEAELLSAGWKWCNKKLICPKCLDKK